MFILYTFFLMRTAMHCICLFYGVGEVMIKRLFVRQDRQSISKSGLCAH